MDELVMNLRHPSDAQRRTFQLLVVLRLLGAVGLGLWAINGLVPKIQATGPNNGAFNAVIAGLGQSVLLLFVVLIGLTDLLFLTLGWTALRWISRQPRSAYMAALGMGGIGLAEEGVHFMLRGSSGTLGLLVLLNLSLIVLAAFGLVSAKPPPTL